ncbi:oxidoreductase [Verticillium alfalfae VaMs.102]|uniref:Oxidoreductase n=1 Tax=Verticillium alfalfae (strain VaMs.102 / ATCC MYA-4576 / FGSC 10136) TaxID=526221 RepID=C9SN41_VERA1|nr:oxidoreductase [Verticillium alfalfae VaMs.102]EEY20206.1 oxidoreductase [Verticillium alfalfae VaMs.102]
MSTSVGFVGLGAMGFGMACNLQKGGKYIVKGYDVWQPSVERFVADGGHPGQSPRDVAHDSAFLVCMAANAQQVDSILFDAATGALEGEYWDSPSVHLQRATHTNQPCHTMRPSCCARQSRQHITTH